jgi:hypothetical protein
MRWGLIPYWILLANSGGTTEVSESGLFWQKENSEIEAEPAGEVIRSVCICSSQRAGRSLNRQTEYTVPEVLQDAGRMW